MLAKPQGFPRKLGGCAGLDPRLRSALSAGVGDGERGLRRGLRAPGVGVRPKWVLEYSPSNKRIRYFVSVTYVRTGLWTAHKFCGGGVITFLEESGRQSHNRLAADLRRVFRESLTAKLKHITDELSIVPSQLYAALIDLYQIPSFTETLGGFLTLNYDGLIEHAIHSQHGKIVDYGISLSESPANPDDSITLLKLHGSFDWLNEWPIRLHQPTEGSDPLWIPPGIQKAKEAYPFNILWGRARELLECDVLRIVGCNLSANDWDLVSMLFRTKHGHSANRVFEIELIDSPRKALELQKRFPYLKIKSLLDLTWIGKAIVTEMIGGPPQEFGTLDANTQERILSEVDRRAGNSFLYWLKLKTEQVSIDLESIDTERGFISAFLNS